MFELRVFVSELISGPVGALVKSEQRMVRSGFAGLFS
jgi:hypothetical protein